MAWTRTVFGKSGFGAVSANRCVDQLNGIWREAGMPSLSVLHRKVGNDQYEMWLCPASSLLAAGVLTSYGFESSAEAPNVELYKRVYF